MENKLKHPGLTGLVLILSAFACSADSMTLQPIVDLLATEVFPQYGYATVSMIMTVSAVALGIISLVSGVIVKIGKKRLLLIGSLLFAIGGLAGMAITNIYYIIATRLIEGLGAGIVLTVSMMLIPEIFSNQKKVDKLMGFNGVMTSLFAIIITMTTGIVAQVNWKMPFLFYMGGFVLFILQMMYIPSDTMLKENSAAQQEASFGLHMNKAGVIHAIETFVYSVIGTIFFVCISGVVTELGIGNSVAAGTVTTFDTIGSMLFGFAFAATFQKIKGFSPFLFYVFMTIGVGLMLFGPHNLIVACIAAFIFGMGYNQYFSYFLAKVSMISDDRTRDGNMAISNGIYYVAMFLGSFLVSGIMAAGGTDSTVFVFRIFFILNVILTVYWLIKGIIKKGAVV